MSVELVWMDPRVHEPGCPSTQEVSVVPAGRWRAVSCPGCGFLRLVPAVPS